MGILLQALKEAKSSVFYTPSLESHSSVSYWLELETNLEPSLGKALQEWRRSFEWVLPLFLNLCDPTGVSLTGSRSNHQGCGPFLMESCNAMIILSLLANGSHRYCAITPFSLVVSSFRMVFLESQHKRVKSGCASTDLLKTWVSS